VKIEVCEGLGKSFTLTVAGGGTLPYDLDCDGDEDAADAACLFRLVSEGADAPDVNGDGKGNNRDAIGLFRRTVCTTETPGPTKEEEDAAVYARLIALKSLYPEGLGWTDEVFYYYLWNGGIFSGGTGSVSLAFRLSDAVFGDVPARQITEFTYEELRVGDILRMDGDTLSVVILEKHEDHLMLVEGNYNGIVHWGRTISREEAMQADYVITRYPA
jgi:hypothetical protein